MTVTTITPVDVEAYLKSLDAESMDHLGSTLRERARHRRVPLTEARARQAIRSAPLTEAWEKSQLSDVGRVRTATRLLISEHHLHPEQILDAMSVVANELIDIPGIASEAIAHGIADAQFEKEGDDA